MDKASAYGAGDCRFESYRGHCLDTLLMTNDIKKRGYHVSHKRKELRETEGRKAVWICRNSLALNALKKMHLNWLFGLVA